MGEDKVLFSTYSEKVLMQNLLDAHTRICETGTAEDIIRLTGYCLNVTKGVEFEVDPPVNTTEVIHYFEDLSSANSSDFETRYLARFGPFKEK